jgi:hypothetical protein
MRQAVREEAHRGVPVDERVMHLHVHCKPPSLEALNKMDLPGRVAKIDGPLVLGRHDDAELALIARRRQGDATDVSIEVHFGIFDPRLERVQEDIRGGELHVPGPLDGRGRADLVDEPAHEVGRRVRGRRKGQQRSDVHHGLGRLHVEEHPVARREALLAHWPILRGPGLKLEGPLGWLGSTGRRALEAALFPCFSRGVPISLGAA